MVVEGVTAKKERESGEDHYYCCNDFLRSRCNRKVSEQTSSFTDDKYYCIVDGFGHSILENILYCPYCGSKLVGC
ncbi:MAG: hypothetical protein M3Y25_02575 [Thermoproteota archaeon]|nr:hypothetical protein [Thermoproteota archaeon]